MLTSDLTLERSFSGHKASINSVAFNPCPSELATTQKRRSCMHQIQIACASNDGITICNYTPGNEATEVYRLVDPKDQNGSPVNHLAYSPSGCYLASCSSSDKTVQIWTPKRNGNTSILKGHNGVVRCVDFSNHTTEEDSLLVTCSDDKTLKVWDFATKSFQRCLWGHTNFVRSCKFSPDSKYVVSGGDDGTVKLWDLKTGDSIVTYRPPSSSVQAASIRHVHFNPSGNLISACLSDGNVHIYDLRSDNIVHSISQQKSTDRLCTNSISFLPGGNHLLSINTKGKFTLWDVRYWNFTRLHHHFEREENQNHCKDQEHVFCCDISNDGKRVVTSWPNNRIMVWKENLEQVEVLQKTFRCHGIISNTSNNPNHQKSKVMDIEQGKMKMRPTKLDEANTQLMNKQKKLHVDTYTEIKELGLKKVKSQTMPIVGIIDHIVNQLDTITSTMIKLEQRLAIQEQYMSEMRNQTMSQMRKGKDVCKIP